MENVIPIIVFGRQRSGTKWLSNCIANHKDAACVQSLVHKGILETNLFERMESVFGDLAIFENRMAFLFCYTNTAFYNLTKLKKEFLFDKKFTKYEEVLGIVLDEYAKINGKSFWVQKLSSHLIPLTINEYPKAKFIIVQRNLIDNYKSKKVIFSSRRGGFGIRGVIQGVFGFLYNLDIEKKYYKDERFLFVKYENLVADKHKTLSKVNNFIGLDYDPSYSIERFPRNTSFRKIDRSPLRLSEIILIKFFVICSYQLNSSER